MSFLLQHNYLLDNLADLPFVAFRDPPFVHKRNCLFQVALLRDEMSQIARKSLQNELKRRIRSPHVSV